MTKTLKLRTPYKLQNYYVTRNYAVEIALHYSEQGALVIDSLFLLHRLRNEATNRRVLEEITASFTSYSTVFTVSKQYKALENLTVLLETWLGNESDISIPNFNCIVKNKRPNTRAGGVARYQNSSDAVTNIITPSMECSVSQSDIYGTIQSSVGICA
ncbi:hypothetical protein TNCV_1786471 [Trichonephila clavipes]|nr:hypothetical protein TNCV_1786471 [Trichonephila clavipes]